MLSPLDNDLMLPSLVDAQITYVWQRTEHVGGEAQDVQTNQSRLGGAMQSNNVPHFNYHLANPLSMRFGCVEMDGKIIHKIANIDEFYYEFGFTPGMSMAGVLPEEYIWAEYIQNATGNFVVCLQIRIIKYLIKHSEKYGEQCKVWLDAYLKEAVAKAVACADCRMKPICEKLKIST